MFEDPDMKKIWTLTNVNVSWYVYFPTIKAIELTSISVNDIFSCKKEMVCENCCNPLDALPFPIALLTF